MDIRISFMFSFIILLESLFFLLCKTYPMENRTLSTEVKNFVPFPLYMFRNVPQSKNQSFFEKNKTRTIRRRRFDFEEEENSGDRGPVEDIAAIKQIIDLLRSVGQRVIPIVMQGASVLNNLLSNLGT